MTPLKSYVLLDSFDGRTLSLLRRVSSRVLARKHAREFAKQYEDGFDLIEIRNGGERFHIQHYCGAASMTPLTAAQVAKARRSWTAVLAMESPGGQVHAVAFWAALWAEPLLAAAEVLMSLEDAVRVPRTFQIPQPELDPDT